MNSALKWKLLAGFLLVFVAGGMTGAFLGAAHTRQLFGRMHEHMLAERMRDRLRNELQLNDEQLAKIGPIIDQAAGRLHEIRRSTTRQVHETLMDAHREIAPMLNAEQRVKLTKLEAHPRHWRWFGHRGPPRLPADSPPPSSP